MGKIVILDELTSNQIAAGEVVERPSSVVKELLENSIDAKSTSISVEIKSGGIGMIKVTDNGSGLDEDDIEIAFERHATSKIKGPRDLESILTYGFRGEALASIASVSNIELITCSQNMQNGRLIRLSAGKVIETEPFATPIGTTITVNDLFFNTPARYKFLKKDTTEAGYVADIVMRVALGNPHIAFKFINNRSVSMHTPGNNDLLSTIFSLYGKETSKQLLPASYSDNGIKATGFVGTPDIARSNRNSQSFFINNRYIKNKTITAAIDEAYRTILMKNKHPFVILNLEINPQMVDVNVHPAKTEVRFSNEQDIFRVVYNAVNNAILHKQTYSYGTISNFPKTIDTALQRPTGITHLYDMETLATRGPDNWVNEPSGTKSVATKIAIPVAKQIINTAIINPVEKIDFIASDIAIVNSLVKGYLNASVTPKDILKISENPEEPHDTNYSHFSDNLLDTNYHEVTNYPQFADNPKNNTEASNNFAQTSANLVSYDAQQITNPVSYDVQQSTKSNCLFGEGYQVLGQLFQTYIIIQNGNNAFLIDQHAAHERIRFEDLKTRYYKKDCLSQMLIVPVTLTLTFKEAVFLSENKDFFDKMGFIIDEFGQNSFLLRSTPYGNTTLSDPKELFLFVFDYFLNNFVNDKVDILMEETLYQLACKSAVKANHKLTDGEIRALISALSQLENPHTCPHGRPTVLKLSKYEIEKLFKRIV